MRTREEDFVSHLFVASTHAYIMIFSDRGRAYWLKVHEIPDVGPDGRGKAIANLVSMEEGERIAALLAVKEFEDEQVHRHGHAARRRQEDRAERVQQPARRRHHRDGRRGRRRGDRRAGLRRQRRDLHRHARRHGDPVPGERRPVDGPHGVRRPRHLAARRRRGRGDGGADARAARSSRSPSRATASAPSSTNTASSRAAASASSTSRPAIATARSSASPRCTDDDELMLITQQGKILRMASKDIRTIGRATQGVRLIDIEGDDRAVSIARLAEKDEEEQIREWPSACAADWLSGRAPRAARRRRAAAADAVLPRGARPRQHDARRHVGVLRPAHRRLVQDFSRRIGAQQLELIALTSRTSPRSGRLLRGVACVRHRRHGAPIGGAARIREPTASSTRFEIERRGPRERSTRTRGRCGTRPHVRRAGQFAPTGVHADAPGRPLVRFRTWRRRRVGADRQARPVGDLRDFELRELRAQRLLPHRGEPHDQLGVVVERLDAEDRADRRTAGAARGGRASGRDGTDWSSSSYA